MTLDEFIAKLQELSAAGHGSLPVITDYDDQFGHLDDDDFGSTYGKTVAVGVFEWDPQRPYKEDLVGRFVALGDEDFDAIEFNEATHLRSVRIKS